MVPLIDASEEGTYESRPILRNKIPKSHSGARGLGFFT